MTADNRRFLLIFAFFCVLDWGVTTADTLVSNLAEPLRATTPIGNPEYWGAQSFLVADQPFELTSVELITGDGLDDPAVLAELRSDAAGEIDATPSGLLTSFTAPALDGPQSVRSFLPDSSVTLQPATKYWFVLGSLNAGTFGWSYADTNLFTGPGLLDDFADSNDAGATWLYHIGEDFPFFLQVTGSFPPTIDADFNDDGLFDCLDVDSLVVEIVAGSHTPAFDLTGDALVDTNDLDRWRADAGAVNLASMNPYLPGDANLDGVVDGSDFGLWNSNKFTSVAAWCSGDFNADGVVDGSDFGIWNGNKFMSADGTGAVPEPVMGFGLLVIVAVTLRVTAGTLEFPVASATRWRG